MGSVIFRRQAGGVLSARVRSTVVTVREGRPLHVRVARHEVIPTLPACQAGPDCSCAPDGCDPPEACRHPVAADVPLEEIGFDCADIREARFMIASRLGMDARRWHPTTMLHGYEGAREFAASPWVVDGERHPVPELDGRG